MTDETERYLTWRETNKQPRDDAQVVPPQLAQTQDAYQKWRDQQQKVATDRASLLLDHAGSQADAGAGVIRAGEAQAQGLSIPPDVLTDATSELSRKIESQTRRALLARSSRLSDWIVKDPINAALAQSELRNLSGVEGLVQSAHRRADQIVTGTWNRLRVVSAENDLEHLQTMRADTDRSLGSIVEDVKSEIDLDNTDPNIGLTITKTYAKALGRYLTSRLNIVDDDRLDEYEKTLVEKLDSALQKAATNSERVAQSYGSSATVAHAQQVLADIGELEGMGEQVAALGAFIADEPGVFTEWLANVVVESAPGLVVGSAVTLATRRPSAGAAAMGLVSGATGEAMTFDKLVRDAGYDMTDPVQRAQIVSDPIFRRQMRDRAFAYGAVVGLMDAASGGVASRTMVGNAAGEMVLQAITQGVMGGSGEALASLASGQDINMVEVLVEVLAEVATGPLEVVGVGGRYLSERRGVEQDRRFFDALGRSAEESGLRKKVPAKYREAIDSLTKDGPVETLYVDAQALDELFQSDPEGVSAVDFLTAVPNVDIEAYRRALDIGGTIEIPTSSYATDIVGTRFDKAIREYLRTDPARMSAAELRAYREQLKTLSGEVQTAVKNAENMQTDLDQAMADAHAELVSSLRSAGRLNDISQKEALQQAHFAQATAQRMGITSEEFLARYPLADVRGALESDPANVPRVTVEVRTAVQATDAGRERSDADIVEALDAEGIDAETATPDETVDAVERYYAGEPLQQDGGVDAQRGVRRLPDLERASAGPVGGVREVASAYMKARGLPVRHQANYVKVDRERAEKIAAAYEAMENNPQDPEVKAAYDALVEETIAQYEALLELGYTFEFIEGEDPYNSPRDAIVDMQENKHLWVFPTDDGFGSGVGETKIGVDNPGGQWLKSKVAKAEEDMATAPDSSYRSKGLAGSTTAYTKTAVMLPVADLAGVPGAQNEAPAPGSRKYDDLAADVAARGFQQEQDGNAILVGVNHLGQPYLLEGNHRVAVAAANGIHTIRAEVRWYNGGETADGTFTPAKVKEMTAPERGNPLLAMTDYEISGRKARVNDLFRIVHDVFGHGSEGASFGARGEENAWQAHVRMFTPLAARAMTSETRGQNSWVNFGPFGEQNRADPTNTTFADQKVGLLPKWASEVGQAEDIGTFDANNPRVLRQRKTAPNVPTNSDGTITLTHFSDEARDTISPAKAGTGPLRGAERNRRGPNKSFFGIGVGQPGGYRKESLGPYKHTVRVAKRDLYDLTRDPDKLVEAIPTDTPSMQRMGWVEEQIQAKGLKGYFVREGPHGMSAALFDDTRPDSVTDDRMVELFQSGANPDFFSALTREVENAKQKKAGAKEWFAIIQKLPGVKKAEIQWSGVEAWLFSQEGQIAREDVAAYLRDNEVTVETVTLSGDNDGEYTGIDDYGVYVSGRRVYEEDEDYLAESGWDAYGDEIIGTKLDEGVVDLLEEHEDDFDEAFPDTTESAAALFRSALEELHEGGTPFVSTPEEAWIADVAVLPENYEDEAREQATDRAREDYNEDPHYEVAFTVDMPNGSTRHETVIEYSYGDVYHGGEDYPSVDAARDGIYENYLDEAHEMAGEANGNTKWGEWTETGGENYREVLLTVPDLDSTGPNAALSVGAFVNHNHFDEPNIVVHARMNARVAANGDKVLFVEEVQSDLGSYWRDKGGAPTLRNVDTAEIDRAREVNDRAQQEAADARTALSAANDAVRGMVVSRAQEAGVTLPENPTLVVARARRAHRLGTQPDDTGGANPAFDAALDWVLRDLPNEAYDDVLGAADDARGYEEETGSAAITSMSRLGDLTSQTRLQNPITPFEEEAYYSLMVKKLLKMAAEEGADRLAWTPAYMQARRWSGKVRNVVNEITWNSKPHEAIAADGTATDAPREVILDGVNGTDGFLVSAEGIILEKSTSGGPIPEADAVGKTLSEMLGGVMARRIMGEPEGVITNENIVVGGDGYKISYDQQIKRFVEKFAKKYGGKLIVDTTMPDFVKSTNSDPLAKAVKRFGFQNMIAALRESDVRTPKFWAELDQVYMAKFDEAEARVDKAIAENEAQIAEYEATAAALVDAEGFVKIEDQNAYSQALDKSGRLQLMTETRYQEKRDFADPERRAQTVYINIIRERYITEANVKSVLPADALPQGDAVWSVTITDKMRDAAKEAQPLFQRRPDGARGSILLPTEPGRAPVINLFKDADLSTVLHESAHYYLHVLQDIAARGGQKGSLVADWETIKQWWAANTEGIAKDGGVTQTQVEAYLARGTTGDLDTDRKVNVGMQEQWARAYEAYLMEGKAPSNALRAAFESFSAWLLSVYKSVRDLNVEVSDEMRGVFDRLLATDEEIADATRENGFDKLVAASAAELGVTEEEYQKLVMLSVEAQDEAKQQLLKDIMAPIRRARTAEYREERKGVEAEIRTQVNAKPANRVREWLGNARWLGDGAPAELPGDLRLDRQMLIDEYGRAKLDALPRGRQPIWLTGSNNSADDVAGWFGYKSGSEMLDDLISMPKADDEIKARTDAEMRKRHGDPLSDGSIEEAAVDAIHGEKRGQLLAAELRAIGKVTKRGKVTSRSQAAEIARRTIRQMPIRKAVRSGQYLAAERRAGNRAALAMARGDKDEAFAAKREQLLNHQLYMESKKADEVLSKVESRVASLKKKSVRKNLAGEYLEAIDDILTSYDFRKSVTQRATQRRAGLQKYIEMMKAEGRENELAIPSYVLDEAKRRPYKALPVNELEGVLDSLRNIEHTARMKKKLRDAKAEREMADVIDGVVREMDTNLEDRAANRVATPAEKRAGNFREFANLLLNADTILRKLGGFEFGAAYEAIKSGIDAAADQATVARAAAAKKFEELYSPYNAKDRRRMAVRTHYVELGGAFTKWDLISAALNMGNSDNLSRLMDKDSGAGFNATQVEFIKAQLDKRDWDFVQNSWDFINSYWAQIEARERRLTGVAPKKVQATEVETPHGTYAGGYYPIRYRGDVSGVVAAEELAQIQQNMLAGRFGKAQTRNGHLEERAQGSGGRQLQLGIEVMHQHVGQVIHDLAFSEPTANAWRVLQKLRGTFERKGLLKDFQALELWLQDTATGQIAAGGVFGRLALRAKNGFTLSKLAFNLSTVAVQLTGIAQSIVVVGAGNMAYGYGVHLADRQRTTRDVIEMSPFMRERETTFNRDINDILGDVMVGPAASRAARFQQGMGRAGFWLMQKVQFYGVDVPTWYGAHRQGMEKYGDEMKARAHADRMVARAQASGVFSDRSAFERGTLSNDTRQNGFVRLFTALGAYMFAKGNIAYEVAARTRRDVTGFNLRSLKAAIEGASSMVMLFTIEAIAYNLIKGTLPGMGDDDDDESWAAFLAKETALSMMSTMPGIRDVASSLSGFEAGAYGSVIDTFTKPMLQAAQGEADVALAKAISSAMGVITGIPSGQLNRIGDAWYRLEQGDDVAPVEFFMGRR